jgi:hypothetical protein
MLRKAVGGVRQKSRSVDCGLRTVIKISKTRSRYATHFKANFTTGKILAV